MMDYSEFRRQYEERHQASIPVRIPVTTDYTGWLKWVVLLMFTCAALLSGVHTVPVVRQGIEQGGAISDIVRDSISLLSFVAVELAIFISAYMMVRGSRWLAYVVLVVAFLVAMVANIYSVSKAYSANESAWVIAVSLTLGVGAPLIALMAGKMFVNMQRTERYGQAKADEQYRADCIAFEAEILSAYEDYTKKLDRRTSRTRRPIGQETADSGQLVQRPSGYGYERTSDAQDKVKAHLEQHPEDFSLSVRALAEKLQVGKSTVADARRIVSSSNGHQEAHE